MAFLLGARAAMQLAFRSAMRRGATRFAARRAAIAAGSRHLATRTAAGRAAGRGAGALRGAIKRNPMTAGFYGGMAANSALGRGKRKFGSLARASKRHRKFGPVPKTPSSTVSRAYAVAPTMTKLRKSTKKASLKQPKSAIVHYKEYGQYNATQCMYINHEHIGSVNKMWFGIALGLTKSILARAKIYPAKSIDDPMIGPRSSPGTFDQYDNKSGNGNIRLVFAYNTAGTYNGTTYVPGNQVTFQRDIPFEDTGLNPDEYRPFSQVARDVANELMTAYHKPASTNDSNAWLAEAQILNYSANPAFMQPISPIYIQNLDDAEIHLYVNSLLKFQNITIADHGYEETGTHGAVVSELPDAKFAAYSKDAIDANPLIGRVYSSKGLSPDIDTELGSTMSTLDAFFQNRDDSGITLCGSSSSPSSTDMSRIQHIPTARELYGAKPVTTGHISIGPGAMKFHKTTFSMVKTFKELANYMMPRTTTQLPIYGKDKFRHTLFGFKCAHKHGADQIQIGYNREQHVGCYIKTSKKLHPLKAAYNEDMHTTTVAVVPAAITNEADGIDA